MALAMVPFLVASEGFFWVGVAIKSRLNKTDHWFILAKTLPIPFNPLPGGNHG
jgi:hypothetical protein